MIKRSLIVVATAVLLAATAAADWQKVVPGVDFQEFREDNYDVYVTRIDLTSDQIAVIGARESEKGMKVSDFARKVHAIAAINADYFDDKFNPIGLTVGPCGEWDNTRRNKKESLLALGDEHVKMIRQTDVDPTAPAEDWMQTAVSGWPMLVVDCEPLTAAQLPGSDAFTRSPHPRSAVGLSRDQKTLYLVVADGRRTGVPGMTLPQLAKFMSSRLSVCSAMNFDGGGSSTMWVTDRVVNRPSDGVERPVGDQLAVVLRRDLPQCDLADEARKIAINKARDTKTAAEITTTTTTTTTTTVKSSTQKPQTSSYTPAPPNR
jgi:exopolysaccharide biosynthesis protein